MTEEADKVFRAMRAITYLECVKCGRKDGLSPYLANDKDSYTEKGDMLFGTTTKYSWDFTYFVPVCEKCKAEFAEIDGSRGCLRFIDGIIVAAFAIVLIVQWIMGAPPFNPLYITSFIIVIVGIVMYAAIGDIYDKRENSRKNYIKTVPSWENGKPVRKIQVKPQSSEDWIDYRDWIEDIIKRKEQGK